MCDFNLHLVKFRPAKDYLIVAIVILGLAVVVAILMLPWRPVAGGLSRLNENPAGRPRTKSLKSSWRE
jgi:glycopeptide antibiotics resistance protein